MKEEVFNQMLDVLEHFCWKVETGKAHSTQTYEQAKQILERVKGEEYTPQQKFERRD